MDKMIKSVDMIIVRIYILESSNLIQKIFDHLEKTVKIRGVSLFRGLRSFGETGDYSSSVFDVRWDLPIIYCAPWKAEGRGVETAIGCDFLTSP